MLECLNIHKLKNFVKQKTCFKKLKKLTHNDLILMTLFEAGLSYFHNIFKFGRKNFQTENKEKEISVMKCLGHKTA